MYRLLGEAIAEDPGKTSFHRALALSQGTVAVLDPNGVIFTRIWCCYEAHVSLVAKKPGARQLLGLKFFVRASATLLLLPAPALAPPATQPSSPLTISHHHPINWADYLFDVYTAIGRGKAVGLTDGVTSADLSNTVAGQTKMTRERCASCPCERTSSA